MIPVATVEGLSVQAAIASPAADLGQFTITQPTLAKAITDDLASM
ncbi:MAG: hypothetical protein QM651_01455 [Rhodoblastus sp.]